MNFFHLLFVGSSLFLAPAPDDPTKNDKAALQGAWKAVSAEEDGQKDKKLPDVQLTFKDDRIIVRENGVDDKEEATFKLDSSKKPRTIDIELKKEGKTILGIYVIEKDTLKMCFNKEGKDRPTEFATKPGSGHSLIVLERIKP